MAASFALRLSWRFALAVLLTATGAAGAVLAGWGALAAFLTAATTGLALGGWLFGRELAAAVRTLRALRDGVRGFAARDFTLELAVTRGDELGELTELYDALGDALRHERSALRQQEALLDTVLQTTPTALLLLNARSRIVFANRAARQLFEPPRRLEGESFDELLASAPVELAQAFGQGNDTLFSYAGPEAGGEEEIFHVGRRRFELAGQPHTLVLLSRMTAELRRQEVEVWKRTIRTMSHEINNTLAPVASLARSAASLLERPEARPRLAEALAVIEERADHLRSFLDGYARLARLPPPAKRELAWAPLLDELVRLYPFTPHLDPRAPAGWGDPGQLQQVLLNLLKNAHEAGGLAEEIALEILPAPEGGVRLRVLDRGTGLSATATREALRPFFSTKPGGSGLGLALCREIVEAHGGRLRLEGRPEGGTAAVIWLPGR